MKDSAEMFKKLARDRDRAQPPKNKPPSPQPRPQEKDQPEEKKRGRPATGKRSNPDWIGRTYYIRKDTDLDIESELLKLKRQGIELDKSELVDFLLSAWVKWRQGEKIEIQLDEILPR
jgi:hypothetical protein